MANITRKQFIRSSAAVSLLGALPPCTDAKDASALLPETRLMIPYPTKPWSQAKHLVGTRPQLSLAALKDSTPSFSRLPLYNDFCLVSDADGHWHCIGILFEGTNAQDFRQDRLFHYIADSLQGPYHSAGYIDLGYGRGPGVWAPFILRLKDRALMFYAHNRADHISIRIAETTDRQFMSWKRGASGKEILVSEPLARDPQVIWDQRTKQYLLYYVAAVGTGATSQNVVRVRTSSDLLSWGQAHTVLGTPRGYVAAESVFVVPNNGYYYLWVSGFDYSMMSLYISTNPFDFGDAATNRIEEQPGHASEIVRADGQYWMACVAIASVSGLPQGKDLPIAQHDLEGVYLQQLAWRAATPDMYAKVVGIRSKNASG